MLHTFVFYWRYHSDLSRRNSTWTPRVTLTGVVLFHWTWQGNGHPSVIPELLTLVPLKKKNKKCCVSSVYIRYRRSKNSLRKIILEKVPIYDGVQGEIGY